MKQKPGIKGCILMMAALAVACTQENPTYIDAGGTQKEAGQDKAVEDLTSKPEAGKDGPVADQKSPLDVKITPDTKAWPDVTPWPDLKTPPDVTAWPDVTPWPDLQPPPDQMLPDAVPWQCKVNGDCNDNLACTTDVCTAAKKCANTLNGGWCNITNTCIKKGSTNSANSCELCDTLTSTSTWTIKANGAACNGDGIFCTFDYCTAGKCAHPVQANWCLISGSCQINKKLNPSNECQLCDVSKSQTAWSNQPSTKGCKTDNLWCTADRCNSGTCGHTVTSGCLLSGKCIPEGEIKPGDSCFECMGSNSRAAYTFVSGKPCPTAGTLAGMCLSASCKGWKESFFQPSGALVTELNAVEYVPNAKQMWAAGRSYAAGTYKGVLVQADSAASTLPSISTSHALNDMSYNVAVGLKGQVYRHSGSAWKKPPATGLPAGADRYSVWGALSGTDEVYLIGGKHVATSAGIYGCAYSASGVLGCATQKGFGANELFGSLFGELSSGTGGSVWGALQAPTAGGLEHIYYNDLSSSTWSKAAPVGCTDGGVTGTSACSSPLTTTSRLGGSGPKDVWLVGSKGLIMWFNGTKWASMSGVITNQTTYSFDAVYSSSTAKLVTIVGRQDSLTGRSLVLFNYNSHLKRWLGPVVIHKAGKSNFKDVGRDINGTGYGNLWIVGNRVPITTPASLYTSGWILSLQ